MISVRNLLKGLFVALSLSLAHTVWADGVPLNGRSCRTDCQDTARTCRATALHTAQSCVTSTCSAQFDAAKTACADNATSQGCRDAINALLQCITPCTEAYKTAVAGCNTDVQNCLPLCPTRDLVSKKDAQCVAGCADTFHLCKSSARDADRTCRENCKPLKAAADLACTDQPKGAPSADCVAARQLARACGRGCEQTRADAAKLCLQAAQACVVACPNVTPSPKPTPPPKPTPSPKPTRPATPTATTETPAPTATPETPGPTATPGT